MSTFYAAFVWGLGVSFGASVGLLAFMVAKAGMDWLLGKADHLERMMQRDVDSLEKLERRNSLTIETIVALDKIAEAVRDRDSS